MKKFAMGVVLLFLSSCGPGVATEVACDACSCDSTEFCLSSIAPTSDVKLHSAGGESVFVYGYGFSATDRVYIGNQECVVSAVELSDRGTPSSLTCIAPLFHQPGTLPVRVVTAEGVATENEMVIQVVFPTAGDGRDGPQNVASGSLDALTGTQSRLLVRFARITGVDSVDPHRVEVVSSSGWNAGDAVLWHVSAAGAEGSCGPDDLKPGTYGVTRVVGVTATGLQLADPLTTRPDQVANSAWASTTVTVGSDFCMVQLVRIPELSDLSMSGNTSIGTPFNYAQGYGGIFPLRARHIQTTAPGTINASMLGYTSGSPNLQGQGAIGMGTSTGANGRGGGTYAGGGGGSWLGHSFLAGAPTNSGGGVEDYRCTDLSCFLFGGGGGGGTSTYGGNGGGALFVWAHLMDGIYSLSFEAGGGPGSTAGGGGGGVVRVIAKNNSMSVTPTFGAPGASTGGAGGPIDARYCTSIGVGGVATIDTEMPICSEP